MKKMVVLVSLVSSLWLVGCGSNPASINDKQPVQINCNCDSIYYETVITHGGDPVESNIHPTLTRGQSITVVIDVNMLITMTSYSSDTTGVVCKYGIIEYDGKNIINNTWPN
jgi:hypothetical protein